MEWFTENWPLIVAAWGALHVFASAITALTPTPKDDAVVAKFYKLIERIALVVGKAKREAPK